MSKTGRNDPCPCGSGRKYKQCHGKPAAELQASAYSSNPFAPSREMAAKTVSIPDALQLAEQHFKAQRMTEAKHLLQEVLKVEQNNADALWMLGMIWHLAGNNNLAIDLLTRAIADSQDPWKHFSLASILHIQNRFPESLVHYKKALSEYSRDFSLRSEFAQSIILEIQRNPDNTEFHRELIDILAPGPGRIRIEPSSACNLRCQHCPTGISYGDTSRAIMKNDVFNTLLSQLKALPTLRSCVLYLGGEPLMNKNFVAMCRQIKAELPDIDTHFNTNGMLLTEAICTELASAHLAKIYISIDGRSPEENDLIREGADYQTVVRNTAMLQKHLEGTGTVIYVSNVVFKRPDDPDVPVTPEFISRDLPGIPVVTNYAIKWPAFDLEKSSLNKISIEPGKSEGNCNLPFTEMSVRPNGDVVLCCYDILGQSVMGNIHQNTLTEIWNNQAYRDLRYSMMKSDVGNIHQICKRCPVYSGEIPMSCD